MTGNVDHADTMKSDDTGRVLPLVAQVDGPGLLSERGVFRPAPTWLAASR